MLLRSMAPCPMHSRRGCGTELCRVQIRDTSVPARPRAATRSTSLMYVRGSLTRIAIHRRLLGLNSAASGQ